MKIFFDKKFLSCIVEFMRNLFLLLIPFKLFCTDLFDESLVKFIFENPIGNHLLFTGNIPRDVSGDYVTTVPQTLQNVYTGSWPRRNSLVVFSLLAKDNPLEAGLILSEYQYFSKNTNATLNDVPSMQLGSQNNRGYWYHWPVRPQVESDPPLDPNITWAELDTRFGSLTEAEVNAVMVNASLNFPDLINAIDAEMTDVNSSREKVLYVHSHHGATRNLAAAAAYLIKSQGYSVQQAYEATDPAAGDSIEVTDPEKVKAYLYYYKRYLELNP